MNHRLSLILALIKKATTTVFLACLLAALAGLAPPGNTAAAARVPPAPQGPHIYVNDLAGVINPDHEQAMQRLGAALDKATGAQVVVVTVESLEGQSIEDYALELFRTWGIGRRDKNNGILLLIVKENMLAGRRGQARIEVGYGLEGAIPDGKAGRILDENVLPAWEQQQYSQGIYQGFLALAGAVAGEYNVDLSKEADLALLAPYTAGQADFGLWPEIILFCVLFCLIASWSARRNRNFRGPRGPFWGGPPGGFGGGGFGGGGFGGGSSGGGGASR